MADEIWIKHNLGTFQQPYIFQQNRNKQSPSIGQAVAQQPAIARQPSTYQKQSPYSFRAPVNYQQPNIRDAQQPNIRDKQSPYIANAQNPFIRNAQTAFTYNHRSPGTYRVPVDYQTPFTYNFRSPGTYRSPVNYRLPFTYNYRSPGTYRYPASAQSPFTYQATTPVIYSYRSPFIYTADTTRVDEFDGSGYEMYDYYMGGAGVSLELYAYRDTLNTGQGDILVNYVFDADGEDWSEVLSLGTSVLWSDESYEGASGTHPGQPAYKIEDTFAGNYTVRRTHSISGDSVTVQTPSGNYSITTTAQALYYWGGTGGRRAVRYGAEGSDYISGTLTGSLVFESTTISGFSYTYSFQFIYDVENEENDCPECCIHEDMLVATSDGDKHINDLKSGDYIYGYNFETDQKELTMINGIKKLERGRIVTVNDTIVTDDHPIFLIDGSLASTNPEATLKNYHKEVKRLEVGDKILDVNNNHVLVETIEPYAGEHKVYTIKTVLDNFYADNILVDSVLQAPKHRMEGTWSQNQ